MVKVEFYSGYRINERPLAFTLQQRSYRVKEVLDCWFGERSQYFKVRADDDNIYLLKYDNTQDQWDLIFYQDSRKTDIVMSSWAGVKPSLWPPAPMNGSPHPLHIH